MAYKRTDKTWWNNSGNFNSIAKQSLTLAYSPRMLEKQCDSAIT